MQTSTTPNDTAPAVSRRSLKRFLAFVRPYRRVLLAAVAFGVVRYLIPLALPWSVKILIDDFLAPHAARPHLQLHLLMLGLCVLYAVYAVASYWRSYLAGLAGHRIILDLRQALYHHLQGMSLGFFDRQQIGGIVSRLTTDIASTQNFVGAALVNTVMDLACVVSIIAVLFAADATLALVSLSVLPCYIIMSHRLQKRIRAKSRAIHHQLQEISGDMHEQFAGMATVQSFTQETRQLQRFQGQSEEYFWTVMSNVRMQAVALGATGFLTALGPILVLWVGAHAVWSGTITVGTLMAFYGYLGLLYQPIQRLTELNLILANSLAAMDRVFEFFDLHPDVGERPGASALGRVRGEVAFERVSFHYDEREPVLKRVELRIASGTTAALVGPSGAGKSTLVKLLARHYDVTEGAIRIDGVDIRDVTLASLRKQIAIVSQEPVLFSGTIADNLRYGNPAASDEAVRAASRAAFAETFIEQLPQGYATPIGERGVRLSGGQKQRLAIARAFLKDAPILILDEPTSALDAESEGLVKQALQRLLEGRTALIIAHRLSTIEHADRVIVLDEGCIIEQGSHAELLKLPDGLYRRYAAHQLTWPLIA